MFKIRVNPIFNNHNFQWLDDVVRAKSDPTMAAFFLFKWRFMVKNLFID